MKAYLLLLALLGLAQLSLAKSAKWTYYYIAIEAEESGSGAKNTPLRTCGGKDIKTVTRHFAERAHMEGTARLTNGVLINLGDCDNKCKPKEGKFDCFEIVNGKKFTWGKGMKDNDMIPYVSVAANDIPYNTKIEVKQLKGLELPGTNGLKHNGCVAVHDESWSFGSQHIDFFVGREAYYLKIDKTLKEIEKIDYEIKNCQLLNYGVPSPINKKLSRHHHHE
jgi:hypothetical protein